MNSVITVSQVISQRFLRYSLAVVLLWIGALKFVDPSPVVGLLSASLPFLAFDGLVYFFGVIEISAAVS